VSAISEVITLLSLTFLMFDYIVLFNVDISVLAGLTAKNSYSSPNDDNKFLLDYNIPSLA